MLRSGKCKICKTKVVDREAMEQDKGIVLKYKEQIVRFCCEEHCSLFFEQEKEKEIERQWLDKFTFIVKGLLQYDSNQSLPISFYTRLKDLKNGTDRGGVRTIRNGANLGYPYEVIFETFKTSAVHILYAFGTKSFSSEGQKINYMMAIVESKVNDEYIKWKRNKQYEESQKNNSNIVDVDTMTINEELNVASIFPSKKNNKACLADIMDLDDL